MAQECPVKTDGKAQLAFGREGKFSQNIAHQGFPVRATLRMELKLHRNDDYVLDSIVEAGQDVAKAFIPSAVG